MEVGLFRGMSRLCKGQFIAVPRFKSPQAPEMKGGLKDCHGFTAQGRGSFHKSPASLSGSQWSHFGLSSW